MQTTLIQDARHVLNHRSRGHEARVARLAAAGAPATDHTALRAWLQGAEDAAHTGLYHACTVRESNGGDADLPVRNKIACRISRVPIKARLVEVGQVVGEDDDGNDLICEDPFWSVQFGNVGPGYMETTTLPYDEDCATATEAETKTRLRLLARGDCFENRAAARAAVEAMLNARANA